MSSSIIFFMILIFWKKSLRLLCRSLTTFGHLTDILGLLLRLLVGNLLTAWDPIRGLRKPKLKCVGQNATPAASLSAATGCCSSPPPWWPYCCCLWWYILPCKLSTASASTAGDDGIGTAETRTPVSRNLQCFLVTAVALWIATSPSLHEIARSSWHKRNPLFSCKISSRAAALAPRRRWSRGNQPREVTGLANITKRWGWAQEEGVAVVLASEPDGAVDAAVHRLGISAAGYTLLVHPYVAFVVPEGVVNGEENLLIKKPNMILSYF